MHERRHVVIAGTGRAGTSFLLQFLAECGVPAGNLDDLAYSNEARAGYELNVLIAGDTYLVKDPWFHEYMDAIDLKRVEIEAVIMPVRDLRAAALSRVRQELATMFKHADLQPRRSTHGVVPGGVVYSLSAPDQERLLAVGQARLLSWCLENAIPVYLLHFPRLVNDGEYVLDILWPWLSRFCGRGHALEVFHRLSAPQEWLSDALDPKPDDSKDDSDDILVEIEALLVAIRDVKAERDELARRLESLAGVSGDLADQLGQARTANEGLADDAVALHRTIADLTRAKSAADADLVSARAELDAALARCQQLSDECNETRAAVELLKGESAATEVALASARAELTDARGREQALTIELAAVRERTDALANELDALQRSRSYRLGRAASLPVRLLRRASRSSGQ